MSEVKRYELVSRNRGMESWNEMQERPDGDYVTFEDFELATKARDGVFSQIVKSLAAERDQLEKQRDEAYKARAGACRVQEDQHAEIGGLILARDANADVAQKRAVQIRLLEDIVRQLKAALEGAPWRLGYQDDRIEQAKQATKAATAYFA